MKKDFSFFTQPVKYLAAILLLCNFSHAFAANFSHTHHSTMSQTPLNSKNWCFQENKGQLVDKQGDTIHSIKYYGKQGGVGLYCQPGKISFIFSKTVEDTTTTDSGTQNISLHTTINRADLIFIGADSNAVISASEQQQAHYHYNNIPHAGRAGIANVRSYKTVTYENIYPHINLVLHATDTGVTYEFVINPGGNVNVIKMEWNGLQSIASLQNGGISYALGLGVMGEGAPYSYQNGKEITSKFVVDSNLVSFNIDSSYDTSQTLTIDPAIMWATYYGGSSTDVGEGLTLDASGNVYITGYTQSTSGIATTGAYQTSFGGSWDAFLAKFNSTGSLQWATYFGGPNDDKGFDVTIDDSGYVYMMGYCGAGISMSSGAYQTSCGGGYDVFVAKFTNGGLRKWATYYGGSGNDDGNGIITDNSGNVYITGCTTSTSNIATSGAYKTSNSGGSSRGDVFLAKFSNTAVHGYGLPTMAEVGTTRHSG